MSDLRGRTFFFWRVPRLLAGAGCGRQSARFDGHAECRARDLIVERNPLRSTRPAYGKGLSDFGLSDGPNIARFVDLELVTIANREERGGCGISNTNTTNSGTLEIHSKDYVSIPIYGTTVSTRNKNVSTIALWPVATKDAYITTI